MAGVGETGVWRTGVWVEPLDAEGDFALSSSAELAFVGRFSYAGLMELEGNGVIQFRGEPFFRGEFDTDASAVLNFDGDFVPQPGNGIFRLNASAVVKFAWVPFIPGPGSEVGIPTVPAEVGVKTKPGDVFIFNGVAGTVVKDSTGRLLVIDHNGEVMCILGPSEVELP